MAKLFVCYSRRDSIAAQKLMEGFRSIGQDIWVDWELIPPAVDWLEQIFRGIEEADVFIFLISPDSITSEVCKVEIGRAALNNKRIIPIVLRDVHPKDTPENISKLNWTFMRESDNFEDGLAKVETSIEYDLDWLEEHRRLQVRALEWHRKKDVSLLLRGRDLRNAMQMVQAHRSKDPAPTELQRVYLTQSQRNERNRFIAWMATAITLIMMTVLTYISVQTSRLAQHQLASAQQFANTQQFGLASMQTQLSDLQAQLAEAHTQLAQTYSPQNPTIVATHPVIYTPTAIASSTDSKITTTPTLAPVITPIATASSITPVSNWITQIFEENRNDSAFWFFTTLAGITFTCITSIGALLLGAWRSGSIIFSRSSMIDRASKSLLIVPSLGRWALFIGYRNRLLNQQDVKRASVHYFGVPALDPMGRGIVDTSGNALTEEIAKSLVSNKVVLVIARGGGGKTTLLARWTYLALTNSLPIQLKDFRPVFVTPAYYTSNLIEAVASVLRERDGVAVDKDIARTQMESGKFLILFDGVSEIEGDQNKGLQEILRTAQNADYQNCRFVVTARPGLNIPSETAVYHLQPLTSEVILGLLHIYKLDKEQEYLVRSQLNLFGEKPVEPLLFSMILEQVKSAQISRTRSLLYEKYFRRLLKVNNDTIWEGWNVVLGEFANWLTMETGRIGVGMNHEKLVDKISGKTNDTQADSLLQRCKNYYGLPVQTELQLLERLKSSGVMQQGRKWRFAHDTFEEYFAAWYIVTYMSRYEALPDLSLWKVSNAQIKAFVGVIEFIKEIVDEEMMKLLLNCDLPELWHQVLSPIKSD